MDPRQAKSILKPLWHKSKLEDSDVRVALVEALKALDKQKPISVEKSNYRYKAVDVEINKIYHYDASICPKCDK